MRKRSICAILLVVISACLAAGCSLKKPVTNNTTTEKPAEPSVKDADLTKLYNLKDGEALVMVDARECENKGLVKNEKVYLPVSLVATYDSRFYWNANEKQMIIATSDTRYFYKANTSNHTEGDQTITDLAPMVVIESGEAYICTDLIEKFGRMTVAVSTDTVSRVSMFTQGTKVLKASVKAEDGTILRAGRGETYDIVTTLEKGEEIYSAEDLSGEVWTRVMTPDGLWGYVNNLETTTYSETGQAIPVKIAPYELHLMSEKVNMVWHQVGGEVSSDDFKAAIKEAKGLNVISPTWFTFKAEDGSISSLASESYVKNAHAAGLKVWALCDDFTPGVKGLAIFSNTAAREALINNLVSEVTRVGADGINIDFEYITAESAPHFLQFLRELYLACKGKNLVLSTDNYYPNNLNSFYRLGEQCEFIDYIIFMGYDEHYSKSKEAGSVASLPFVRGGVEQMLKKGVPAKQLILGIPFFTRNWSNLKDDDGTVKNDVMSMDAVQTFLKQHDAKPEWDETLGQNVVLDVLEDGQKRSIWIEDAESIQRKLAVLKDNNLAGCAAWRLGFESKNVWAVIKEALAAE